MAKLIGNKIQPSEYIRNVWRANIPVDVLYTDLFVPSFWANIAVKFVRGDIIEAFAEDGSWYAQLIVRTPARTHAVVGELLFTDFSSEPGKVSAPEPLNVPSATSKGAAPKEGGPAAPKEGGPAAPTVTWKGPNLKFAVVRHDGEYMKTGFETKVDAQAWVDENVESLV